MKKYIFALFSDRAMADQAINQLHNELHISNDDISYVYRDAEGKKVSGHGDDDTTTTADGVVTGATTGGIIGAAVGLVGVAGLLGPLGAIIVAGPLATFLGITGGVGAVVGTGIAGAAIGGLVGALMSMGVSEPQARNFEERVDAGDVLLTISTENTEAARTILNNFNAQEITVTEHETKTSKQ